MILLPEDPPLRKFTVTLMNGERLEFEAHLARPNPTGALDVIRLVGGDPWLFTLVAPGAWLMVSIEPPTREQTLVIAQNNEDFQQRTAALALQTQPEHKSDKGQLVH